jgi:hypothetical protein
MGFMIKLWDCEYHLRRTAAPMGRDSGIVPAHSQPGTKHEKLVVLSKWAPFDRNTNIWTVYGVC